MYACVKTPLGLFPILSFLCVDICFHFVHKIETHSFYELYTEEVYIALSSRTTNKIVVEIRWRKEIEMNEWKEGRKEEEEEEKIKSSLGCCFDFVVKIHVHSIEY